MPLMFHTTVLIQQTQHKRPCPPVGFELTILVNERPQTHALDRTATGIGYGLHTFIYLKYDQPPTHIRNYAHHNSV
jgi:hypothetical protein